MKNIKASVGVFPAQEQKPVEGGGVEEKEYTWKTN